jgi:aspartate 1-decarboxylase
MLRQFCKAKIANARVVKSELKYEGSCGIDSAILEAVDLLPYEWILIANVTSGARFETYAIPEPAGSGTINIYGAAARLANPGDEVIILSFAFLDDAEGRKFRGPKVVKLKPGNKPP